MSIIPESIITLHLQITRKLFPTACVQLLAAQGGCSTTFLVEDDESTKSKPQSGSQLQSQSRIIQFRHKKFQFNIEVAAAAKAVYHKYAPSVQSLFTSLIDPAGDLLCYEMDVIPGVPYSTIMPEHQLLNAVAMERQKRLVQDFADFISQAWPSQPWLEQKCTGRVGSRIAPKLQILAKELPSERLRQIAKEALDHIDMLSRLPTVLNHGDLIASNIMIDQETGALTGVVDWAEAEYLPFGMCLCGLEYFLGARFQRECRDLDVESKKSEFQYYDCDGELRSLFWKRLKERIPALNEDERLIEAIKHAGLVGTLLWYGFAWDDGAIDRVVNEVDDGDELAILEAFLSYS
ncbi:hypothetical protein EJ08DRAFT_617816 [Tothia fuscella]|uniref:Aminoglycoside phosphotransferase domain-containing protein n=1 Tax=Tothia fuscella TaxID=1048955 RepID=A0A9P4NKH6_9PEZI|nr:hypothetical protein EJ08DRAFT_617816 [Tothia fuscella]